MIKCSKCLCINPGQNHECFGLMVELKKYHDKKIKPQKTRITSDEDCAKLEKIEFNPDEPQVDKNRSYLCPTNPSIYGPCRNPNCSVCRYIENIMKEDEPQANIQPKIEKTKFNPLVDIRIQVMDIIQKQWEIIDVINKQ